MGDVRAKFNASGESGLRGNTGDIGCLHYADYIVQKTDPPTGGRILDLGCGDGRVLAALLRLRPDLQCVGVDFADALIARAREEHLTEQKLTFEVRNLASDDLGLDGFDRMYSFSVLQYLSPQQATALDRKLGASLNAGGSIHHLSIPDLQKRLVLFHDSFLCQGPASLTLALLNWSKLLLVEIKRRMTGDRSYDSEGQFHEGEELARLASPDFHAAVSRPSDSWYRFDLTLRPRRS